MGSVSQPQQAFDGLPDRPVAAGLRENIIDLLFNPIGRIGGAEGEPAKPDGLQVAQIIADISNLGRLDMVLFR